MRAAVVEREEIAAEIEHHDIAACDRDQLALARRYLIYGGDDVAGHQLRSLLRSFPRKRESSPDSAWVPAFAGTSGKPMMGIRRADRERARSRRRSCCAFARRAKAARRGTDRRNPSADSPTRT